ncbi:glycosyl hydrolase family 79 C-terminal domain-containing protein [Conexibacter sp. DBS9H8]|uniref:glycosyl hydrolase family 79 C-terminal domain-containing protein n=1 Tax=Conexibacter sp. DBS9H8 TaxID=2937801 RepID=UPI00200E8CA8|nr:glycosyl hydrolase family 79 C-terminal domain-containing protein [Conexibacter sp. DBS9H8]
MPRPLRRSARLARLPAWALLLILALALLGAGGAAAVTVTVTAELIGGLDGHTLSPGRPARPAGARSPGSTATAAATAAATATAPAVAPAGTRAGRRRRRPSARPLSGTVTVVPSAAGTVVPDSFLGLSTEYWDIPTLAARHASVTRVLALLHVPGDGPLLLRVGGDSASETVLALRRRRRPAWARFTIGRRWFRALGAIVRAGHLRIYLDLNTAQGSPAATVAWTRAALAALPPGALQALEIGNEPDLFGTWPGMARLGRAEAALHRLRASSLGLAGRQVVGLPRTAAVRRRLAGALRRLREAERRLPPLLRRPGLTPATYAAVFGADARALAAAFPDLALAGPALGVPGPDLIWQTDALAAAGGHLSVVTGHRYPLSACVTSRRSPSFPTVARLLSPRASIGMAAALRPAIRDAHRLGLPYVLTEFNSVTCGGRRGVSNAFATALWAPAALFSLVRGGVAAANLHVRLAAVNAPFTFVGPRLVARPLLYGLALFARTLGPDARLWHVRVTGAVRHRLRVWAVASRPGLGLLLINPGRRPETLDLRLPAHGHGVLERLLAPGPAATGGVSLAGQRISASGRWIGPFTPRSLTISPAGRAALWLPGHSAALLRVAARSLGPLGPDTAPRSSARARVRA